MNRFLRETTGSVIEMVLVLALVSTIVVAVVPDLREFVMCTQEKVTVNIQNALFNNQVEANCASGKGNKVPEGNGNEDGVVGEEIPMDNFESSGMDLACVDASPYYNFTIPEGVPAQSSGTQKITFKNKKGWDMWVKVNNISTYDGLKITTNDPYYRMLSDGQEVVFDVGWKWDVTNGYKGDRGNAKVSFSVICKPPKEEELYKPNGEAPKNFRVTDTKDTEIALTWDKVNYASEYYVYRNNMLVYKGSDTNYVDKNILPGTLYTYKLYTSITAGTNVFATLQQKTTGVSPVPAVPTGIKTYHLTDNKFHVAWNASAKATHYRLFLNGKDLGTTVWSDTIQYNLKSNTTYKLEVAAENFYGSSEKTSISVTTNGDGALPNPKNFRHIERTEHTQTVGWDPVPGAEKYLVVAWGRVYYEGPDTSFSQTNIGPGGCYHFFVYAIGKNGQSSGIHSCMGPLGIPRPTIPYNINMSNITNTAMSITWTKGSVAEKTVIKMNGEEIYNEKGNNLIVSDLTPNTNYEFEFMSTNGTGNSGVTKNSAFTTNDTYDDVSSMNASCKDEDYLQKLKLPANVKPGGSGTFSIDASNTSNFDLTLKITEVDKTGGLFEGKTPVKLDYDSNPITIKPKQKFSIPVKWSLPKEAAEDYTKQTGEITVHLRTSC